MLSSEYKIDQADITDLLPVLPFNLIEKIIPNLEVT